jgi:16S rRNA (uracil1498-N3)-methyltransferase
VKQQEDGVRRRFFVESFSNGRATLSGDAAHHLGRVLRAEPGQSYELSDGQAVWLARVERVDRDAVEFALVEPVAARESRLRATLLLSIVKFERFEWALEKATELGVGAIVPLAAERSEKALVGAAPKRAERWERILLESAQQARCLRPPVLRPLMSPAKAFQTDDAAIRVLLSERISAPGLRGVLQEESCKQPFTSGNRVSLSIGIGPEGGWTEREFAEAATAGFREASLGGNILRTETAVAAGLAAAHLYFDE